MKQEGTPIAEFIAQSPENAKIFEGFKKGLEDGTISLCACLGPMYGEPYCPCRMKREGLPSSPEHDAANAASAKGLEAFFERNRKAKEV